MSTTPEPRPTPSPAPQTPPPAPSMPPVQAPAPGMTPVAGQPNWTHIGAAVAAFASILGGYISYYQTGSATRSAETATQAEYVTKAAAAEYRDQLIAVMAEESAHEKRMEELAARIRALEEKGIGNPAK